MSGALDKKARATAERLLKKFGKVAVYVDVFDTGEYDTETSTNILIETPHNITCLIDKAQTGNLRANGLINATDLIILVSSKELNIDINQVDNLDKLSFDGKQYSIVEDMPDWSGEEIAMHNFVCKAS